MLLRCGRPFSARATLSSLLRGVGEVDRVRTQAKSAAARKRAWARVWPPP